MPRIAEQQLAAFRSAAARAAANTRLSDDSRDAIALLVAVINDLHQQVDWLRRDLSSVSTASPAPAPRPH